MSSPENLGSYLKEGKNLLRDYVEARFEIYRLKAIRAVAKTGGYLIWILISLFLVSLMVIFCGVTLGFWLSELTGRYTTGFALVTLIYVVIIVLLAAFRKSLFVNPIIRAILKHTQDTGTVDSEEQGGTGL